MKKKRIIIAVAACVLLIALAVLIVWGNTALEVTNFTIKSDKIPKAFSGFRIAQISDLHNAEFGKNNVNLLKMLRGAEPDIIVITGDMVDSRRTDLTVALNFAKEAVLIAPTYYVTGNHEANVPAKVYTEFIKGLRSVGVTVIEDQAITISRKDDTITLVGVVDPRCDEGFIEGEEREQEGLRMEQKLAALYQDYKDTYCILLSHRPELFDVYVSAELDLVFSGHLHGGQFRIPYLGGLYAPAHGFFPEYDAGLFTKNGTNMIVSRGLGNSSFPIRINNRPEIIVVELVSQ